MPVTPYLFFDGRCEEALDFYKTALGAEVGMMMRFSESPEPPPGWEDEKLNKVMHAAFTVNGQSIMASDGHVGGAPEFKGFGLSLDLKDESDAEAKFNALAEGGSVQAPLEKAFFARKFGMVADRFGVSWMLIVAPDEA